MVLNRMRNLFRSKKDIELDLEEATDFFSSEKQEKMDRARREADRQIERIEDNIEDLDESLELLEDYRDSEGRSVIEDVVGNIHESRKGLIKGLNLGEDPEKVLEKLDRFVEKFETMKPKENKVLEHVPPSNQVFARLKDIKSLKSDLEDLLEHRYSAVNTYRSIKDIIEDIDSIEEDIEELRREKENLDPGEIEEKLDEARKELDKIEEDPGWDEKEQKEQKIRDLEQEKREISRSIESTFSDMERGLKKIIYHAGDGDIDFEKEDLELLKEIKEDESRKLPPERVREKLKRIAEKGDIVEGRDRERFLDALDCLEEVRQQKANMAELEEKISDLEEDVDSFELKEKMKSKDMEIERLEDMRNEMREKNERLAQDIDSKKREIEEKKEEVQDLLNEEIYHDIEVR